MGGKPTCSSGNKETLALDDKEVYHIHDFDDPRSSLEVKGHLSGRLKIVRMAADSEMKNVHDLSRPGSLGMSLLTYQVCDLKAYRKRVIAGGATAVTDIYKNEFEEPSISFKSPDGLTWTLVGTLR